MPHDPGHAVEHPVFEVSSQVPGLSQVLEVPDPVPRILMSLFVELQKQLEFTVPFRLVEYIP